MAWFPFEWAVERWDLFESLFWSACILIFVCKSGAVRIILRSTIGLMYAWDLRSLTGSEETPGLVPDERCVLPDGIKVRAIIRRPEAGEVPGSEARVAVFMLVEWAEVTVWA